MTFHDLILSKSPDQPTSKLLIDMLKIKDFNLPKVSQIYLSKYRRQNKFEKLCKFFNIPHVIKTNVDIITQYDLAKRFNIPHKQMCICHPTYDNYYGYQIISEDVLTDEVIVKLLRSRTRLKFIDNLKLELL